MPAVGARQPRRATHRALKLRSADNRRSTGAGIGRVLVQPILLKKEARDRLGTGHFGSQLQSHYSFDEPRRRT